MDNWEKEAQAKAEDVGKIMMEHKVNFGLEGHELINGFMEKDNIHSTGESNFISYAFKGKEKLCTYITGDYSKQLSARDMAFILLAHLSSELHFRQEERND